MRNILSVVLLLPVLCSCASKTSRVPASIGRLPVAELGKRYVFNKYDIPDQQTIYYLRRAAKQDAPLILVIQGSGCDSIYSTDSKGNVFGEMQVQIAGLVESRAHVLAVEKPTVQTFYQSPNPGAQGGCPIEFRAKFTMDLWVKYLKSALSDAITSQGLTPSRIIVLGHSEGAIAAAALAAEVRSVTHVVYASGGGGNPLFEAFVRRKRAAKGNVVLENQYIQDGIRDWQAMSRNPDDSQTLYWGHTPLYWISQGRMSPGSLLSKSAAKIYVVQGTADMAASIEGSDLLVSELILNNKSVEYKRIKAADHGYRIKTKNRMSEVLSDAVAWSLQVPEQ